MDKTPAVSLKESVYNSIIDDILKMEYVPGDILNEKKLIERYNCSKSPVRDALQHLCAENVVRVLPRYGYEVVRINMDEIREMIRFREILECSMIKEGGRFITEEKIHRLEEINSKCMGENSDLWKHWTYNMDFHVRLIGYSGNTYCTQLLSNCMKRMKMAYAQLSWSRGASSLAMDTKNHAGVIAALKDSDFETAAKVLKEDLDDFGVNERL